MECELNEEVGPDKGISFLQGSPNHTHGTRVFIALKTRLPVRAPDWRAARGIRKGLSHRESPVVALSYVGSSLAQ
jgi:hypothetical protein